MSSFRLDAAESPIEEGLRGGRPIPFAVAADGTWPIRPTAAAWELVASAA